MVNKQGYVYILTNKWHTVFYIGVTSNLVKRVYEHKSKCVDGFTKKYQLNQLLYYEVFERIEDAIEREKRLKGWGRSKKIELIKGMNKNWKDLYGELF